MVETTQAAGVKSSGDAASILRDMQAQMPTKTEAEKFDSIVEIMNQMNRVKDIRQVYAETTPVVKPCPGLTTRGGHICGGKPVYSVDGDGPEKFCATCALEIFNAFKGRKGKRRGKKDPRRGRIIHCDGRISESCNMM